MGSVGMMFPFDAPKEEPPVVDSVLVFEWQCDGAEARGFLDDSFVKYGVVEGGMCECCLGVFCG